MLSIEINTTEIAGIWSCLNDCGLALSVVYIVIIKPEKYVGSVPTYYAAIHLETQIFDFLKREIGTLVLLPLGLFAAVSFFFFFFLFSQWKSLWDS